MPASKPPLGSLLQCAPRRLAYRRPRHSTQYAATQGVRGLMDWTQDHAGSPHQGHELSRKPYSRRHLGRHGLGSAGELNEDIDQRASPQA
jgi:hypothetical protein